MGKGVILMACCLAAGCAGLGRREASGGGPALARAREDFVAGRYAEANDSAREALALGISGDEAAFLEAESLFYLDRYPESHARFKKFLADHPDSDRLPQVLLREHQIGSTLLSGGHPRRFLWMRFSRESLGLEILQGIVEKYPYEDFSDDDQLLVANWFYARGEREEARAQYERLVTRFPESEWRGVAEYQIAMCVLDESNGVEYDPTPIEDARRRLKDYMAANPGGDRVAEARGKVQGLDEMQASHAFATARFYRREGRSGAAAIYLKAIIDSFGSTSWAARARETLPAVEREAAEQDRSRRKKASVIPGVDTPEGPYAPGYGDQ